MYNNRAVKKTKKKIKGKTVKKKKSTAINFNQVLINLPR